PADIARRANWGRDALAKVITTPQQNTDNQETGRPALYDNAIGDEYSHNLGIQKGWIH
ncbi:IS256 family transposase, partial [Corynebacterium striatum]|nr:IS256 family transposase [Corynebacterium striatum]